MYRKDSSQGCETLQLLRIITVWFRLFIGY